MGFDGIRTFVFLFSNICTSDGFVPIRTHPQVVGVKGVEDLTQDLGVEVETRVLNHKSDKEFVAAVAVRAASFMAEEELYSTHSRASFDRKLLRIFKLMRSRQAEGSEFVIAVASSSKNAPNAIRRPWDFPADGESIDADTAKTFPPVSADGGKSGWLGGLLGLGPRGGSRPRAAVAPNALEASLLGIGSFEGADALQRLDDLTRVPLGGDKCQGGEGGGGECDDAPTSPIIGRVVGMVDVSRSELLLPTHSLDPTNSFYVCALCVAQAYRRLGLGTLMMKGVEDLAWDSSLSWGRVAPPAGGGGGVEGRAELHKAACSKTLPQPPPSPRTLWLHVEDSSASANALYHSLGFEPITKSGGGPRAEQKAHRDFTAALNLGPNSGAPPNTLMRKVLAAPATAATDASTSAL